ncbi:hypothetical protein BH09MYX1_BH09MYX1_36890 [soil metagenome]
MDLLSASKHGDSLDATRSMYPSRLVVVSAKSEHGSEGSTSYGYVVSGTARLRGAGLALALGAGAFFALPGKVGIEAAEGIVVVIERLGFRALPLAGRIEERGRLAYIDGCSDSILCMPPRLGDPVLNHLHFPEGVVQTPHSHPSIRLGVVARGRGLAYGPDRNGWELPLETGAVFCLHEHEIHAFKTTRGESMDVIAYHPDSDWGPTDGVHPMLNRTYLSRPKP